MKPKCHVFVFPYNSPQAEEEEKRAGAGAGADLERDVFARTFIYVDRNYIEQPVSSPLTGVRAEKKIQNGDTMVSSA